MSVRAILLSQTGFWTERTLEAIAPAFDVPIISGDAPFAWAGPIRPNTSPVPAYDLIRFRLVAWSALPYAEPSLVVYMQETTRPAAQEPPEKESP